MIGGYGGLRLEHDYARGVTLFAESEGLVEDTGSASIYASGGMKVRF